MFSNDWFFNVVVCLAIIFFICSCIIGGMYVAGWSDPVTSTISIKDKMYTDQSKIVIDSDEQIYATNDIITYSNLMIGKSYIVNVSSNTFRKEYRIDGIVREV